MLPEERLAGHTGLEGERPPQAQAQQAGEEDRRAAFGGGGGDDDYAGLGV